MSDLLKILQMGAELLYADRHDELIDAFRDFAKASKN
jgi:hypothetical protein